MKVCVLGAGSLGCAIGGCLAEGGSQVTLVNRSAAHVEALQRHGLTMIDGIQERNVRVAAATNCRNLAATDLLIVLVKSYDTAAAIAGAGPVIGPHTTVLSLQNGLGHEDVLAAAVGRERVLAGKTYVGGVLQAPGRVALGTRGKRTLIGELAGGVSQRALAIAAEFERGGLATTVSADIEGAMWDKLLVNVATGALSGITGLPYGGLYAVPEVQACALAAVAEAMAVARAKGVVLSMSDPHQPWELARAGLGPDFKASMLQSLEKGSLTEVDYINGAVVREGQRLGVPTPANQALVAAIKGIEHKLLQGKEQ